MNIQNFHMGWPNAGIYYNKLNKIYTLTCNYITNFISYNKFNGKKYTVIFDIDDTLVYTDPGNLFPNKKFPYNWLKNYMLFPEIPQIASIAKLCHKLGLKIIIITARPYSSEKSSIKNLELLGIYYDEIYHNKDYPDINFKIKLKEKLSKKENIILSIGDQWPDLLGLTKCLCIKLPSYDDFNAFYTYNNQNYYLI